MSAKRARARFILDAEGHLRIEVQGQTLTKPIELPNGMIIDGRVYVTKTDTDIKINQFFDLEDTGPVDVV